MPDQTVEINRKFLTKLGKFATESFRLLIHTYTVTSRPCVFEGHKRLREGREEVDDSN